MPYKKKSDWQKWYDGPENHARRQERNRLWIAKFYKERRTALDTIKTQSGCVDCGYNEHPAALQFDHIDPKTKKFSISR